MVRRDWGEFCGVGDAAGCNSGRHAGIFRAGMAKQAAQWARECHHLVRRRRRYAIKGDGRGCWRSLRGEADAQGAGAAQRAVAGQSLEAAGAGAAFF